MKKRLQTILSISGISSRRGAVSIIEAGRVKVDGQAIFEAGFRADPEKQKISVDGKPLERQCVKKYYILNKPEGYITTVSDTHGRRKVVDLMPKGAGRVYPVGRLDKDTTGILILTDDGDLTYTLSHPRNNIDKEYSVKLLKEISDRQIKVLEVGVFIDNKKTYPCRITRSGNRKRVRIILHEGRKRQIKKMFESIGNRVLELERTKYAGLTLEGLKRGECRELKKKEVEMLRSIVRKSIGHRA